MNLFVLDALTPTLSRKRERELDSLGTTSVALTPAHSRLREREQDITLRIRRITHKV